MQTYDCSRPDNSQPGLITRCLLVAGLTAALAPAHAMGQVIGFGVDSGINEVVELILDSDGEPMEGRRWPLGTGNTTLAFEVDDSYTAYVLDVGPIGPPAQFRRIDLLSGTTLRELPVPFGGGLQDDFALKANGEVWLLSFTSLRRYDPGSRSWEAQGSLPAGTNPGGIAWWQDRLYVLLRAGIDEDPTLAEVDPATGALSNEVVLSGLISDSGAYRQLDAIDFDETGGLWIGMTETLAVVDPPFTYGMVGHYRNPWTDTEPTSVAPWFGTGYQGSMPFAVLGPAGVPAVPTLDHLGLLGLISLLTAAAIISLHLRRAFT